MEVNGPFISSVPVRNWISFIDHQIALLYNSSDCQGKHPVSGICEDRLRKEFLKLLVKQLTEYYLQKSIFCVRFTSTTDLNSNI